MTPKSQHESVVPHAEGCVISLTVSPRASANRIEQNDDGSIRIRLTAPPVEGAANACLLKTLAAALDVPKSMLHITAGTQSRRKRVLVEGISAKDVRLALEAAIHHAG